MYLALTFTTGPATVVALAVAHAALKVDVPAALLLAAAIVGIVLPSFGSVVSVALTFLYGLVLLPVGLVHCMIKPKDPGHYSVVLLAQLTSLLNGGALPDWASTPAPSPGPTDRSYRHPTPQATHTPSADVLPPARNAARVATEHLFWQLLQDMAVQRPAGQTDVVDTVPNRGRHAKPEPETAEPETIKDLATV